MTSAARVAGLVLAAGAGTRLGAAKPLVMLGGRRLVDRAVDELRDGGCDPVVVVSGAHPLMVPAATVVTNPAWASGMASSLRCGLAALAQSADAVCVLPVDMPGVGAAVVRRLLTAYERRRSGAVVATYDEDMRNPVVLDRSVWQDLCGQLRGDEGARAYLRAHPELVTTVECADIGDPRDVDSPADLAAWLAADPPGGHDARGPLSAPGRGVRPRPW